MKLFRFLSLSLFAAILSLAFTAAPAAAQATRTWVSGVGDDVNPCSRTAPCKTFAGAISKTAVGGEINCLDPAGFGGVTIIHSITIDCHFTEGGVLASGNAIIINAGATDVVYLRGLDILGVNPPTNGVRFLAGAALHIEDSVIRRFNSTNSFGVSFAPSAASKLFISNTTIADNGNGGTGGGIGLVPTGSGSASVMLQNVNIAGNAGPGVRADITGNTGTLGISITMDGTRLVGNSVGMFLFAPAANTVPIKSMVVHGTIANNATPGVLANGSPITALFSDTTITGNGQGVVASGATILSYQDNRLFGNGSNNTFPGTLPKN